MSVLYQVPVIKTESECEDIGSENQQIVIVRQKAKQVLGQISMNHQQQQQQQQQPAAKKRRVSDGSSSKVKPPPAVAVARRNARERNRVKQVNNGFSMLREHIPKEIADTFEPAVRGSAKKLSKVETLRMAVEYIRSLERMLALDTSNDSESSSPSYHHNNTTFSNMSSISETSLPATPPPESQQPFFYALKPHSGVMETQITIVGGQQYIRIPGTTTFQLVTHDLFENEENVHPSTGDFAIQIHPPSPAHANGSGSIMGSTLNFVNEINSSTSVINTTATSETPAGSISPYSGHSSLSPAPSHAADNIGNNIIMEDGQLSCLTAASSSSSSVNNNNNNSGIESDQKLPYNEHLMMHCANTEASHYDNIILKQEIMDDEGMFDENSLSNEHMIDAMQWWEQQQQLGHNQSP